jgi:hypothetical protein
MVSGVGVVNGSTAQRTGKPQAAAAVQSVVPFIRASAEHREPAGIDVSRLLTTAVQDLSVYDIPAYGYVRSLYLLVQATIGAGAGAVAAEDGPWNVLSNTALTEPNGAVIAQFNTGYDLYLANKYGGYRDSIGADPRQSPVFSIANGITGVAGTGGNFSFGLRIPLEINLRDALGSLPNQSAAATFKLRLSLNASTSVFSTPPATTLPTVRVRAFMEAWDQPEASVGGQSNATMPPAMNTTQFWTTQVISYNAGLNTLRFSRVGNYLRNLVLIARRAGTSRANGGADWPDPATLYLDTRPLDIIEINNWRNQIFERTGYGGSLNATATPVESAGGLDNGVFPYDFCHEFDGTLGRENRDLWLPTLTSTRFELQGNFTNSGTLTVLTNDVSVAGSVFL